jgi:Sortase domain
VRRPGRHRASFPTAPLAIAGALVLVLSVPGAELRYPTAPAGVDVPGVGGAVVEAGRPVTLAADTAPRETSPPVRVRIPSIGVDSPLVQLGVDGDGALVPPDDFARAGWFADGPVPGEIGPAVLAGHVDSHDGPAVFFRLVDLATGADVLVDLADGTTVRFTVAGAARYPKDEFPTEDVYGPTPRAELRLITCGGEFDRDRRSYRDNVVVFARLTA